MENYTHVLITIPHQSNKKCSIEKLRLIDLDEFCEVEKGDQGFLLFFVFTDKPSN
jgi:hypothetical protein